jgi:hypothetical protein
VEYDAHHACKLLGFDPLQQNVVRLLHDHAPARWGAGCS